MKKKAVKKVVKTTEKPAVMPALKADITFVSDYSKHSVMIDGVFYNFKNSKLNIPECPIELKTKLLANSNIRELK
jgi:hypothetical protein